VSETRSRIRECVYREPGIHFNDITRRLDIATGQTQYHLRKLTRNSRVERADICGRAHFYPPTYSEWERGVIAMLRRETAREILVQLVRGEKTPSDLTDAVGVARSTTEWHLSTLIEHDIVRKRTEASETGDQLVVELTDRSEVYRLLREVEPSLANRLVDRFTRLTDELLSD
jgi:predicted transcriptional regulator